MKEESVDFDISGGLICWIKETCSVQRRVFGNEHVHLQLLRLIGNQKKVHTLEQDTGTAFQQKYLWENP